MNDPRPYHPRSTMTKLLHAATTDKAWRAYYTVYNQHGHDYPEAFYEEIMRLEFNALTVPCATQVAYDIFYKGVKVGEHYSDMELAEAVVLELKVVPALLLRHYAQLVSYLKVSGKTVGLLLNFGSAKPQGVRRVLTNVEQRNQPLWQPDDPDPTLLYPELTKELRHVVWEVFHTLGPGFVFRVYANATYVELQQRGIANEPVRRLQVSHRGQEIGDLPLRHFIIDQRVVLLPVAEAAINQSDLNKVRVVMIQRGLKLGMVVNFGNEKLEIKYVR